MTGRAGERADFRTRPSPWFVLLESWQALFWLGVAAAAIASLTPYAARVYPAANDVALVILVGLGIVAALKLVWETLSYLARSYEFDGERVRWRGGVLRRFFDEAVLSDVRSVRIDRSIAERLVGAATIGISTAGTSGFEVVWLHIGEPDRHAQNLRRRVDAARGSERVPRPVVIGMAGGVGSGKSTVARAFASVGCLVSDSDAQAKEILTRAEIIDILVSWWGEEILTNDRAVDRSRVAAIVFADEAERRRLEGLIHPAIKQTREELVERALREGADGVVVDAPLLFEAGLDEECDAVVFVDTPRAERLRRVQGSRGWTEEELDRRERAQIGLDEKKSRSDHVIRNSGASQAELVEAARAILQAVKDKARLAG